MGDYEEIVGGIVAGTLQHDGRWPRWFDDTAGSKPVAERVREVWEGTGVVPTRKQLAAALAAQEAKKGGKPRAKKAEEPDEPPAAPEPEAEAEPAPAG